VETYNLMQIDDDDLTKLLQDHARDFMIVGGLKFPAGMKQKIPAWNTGNCRAKNFKVLIRPPWYVNFIYTFTILHFFQLHRNCFDFAMLLTGSSFKLFLSTME